MTEENKSPEKEDKGCTFDMYHFFSRKDVLVAALAIVALLVFLVLKAMLGGQAA